jgi:hypothetical protein
MSGQAASKTRKEIAEAQKKVEMVIRKDGPSGMGGQFEICKKGKS